MMYRADGSDGGTAFPPHHNPENHHQGMTLRDWFAGQALAGINTDDWGDLYKCAERCYRVADAMLEARNK